MAVQWRPSFLKSVCKFLLNMRQLLFYKGLQVGQIRKLLQARLFLSTKLTIPTNTKPLLQNFFWNKEGTASDPIYSGPQSVGCVWPHMISFTKIMITLKIQSFLVSACFQYLFHSIKRSADFNCLETQVCKGKCISEKSLEYIKDK